MSIFNQTQFLRPTRKLRLMAKRNLLKQSSLEAVLIHRLRRSYRAKHGRAMSYTEAGKTVRASLNDKKKNATTPRV